MREQDGGIAAHVCIVEGAINGSSRDRWQRGEKSGVEFVMNGVKYFRYEADTRIIHELQVWPPVRMINGVNQLAALNQALGY
jgi:phage tail tube protein FII